MFFGRRINLLTGINLAFRIICLLLEFFCILLLLFFWLFVPGPSFLFSFTLLFTFLFFELLFLIDWLYQRCDHLILINRLFDVFLCNFLTCLVWCLHTIRHLFILHIVLFWHHMQRFQNDLLIFDIWWFVSVNSGVCIGIRHIFERILVYFGLLLYLVL